MFQALGFIYFFHTSFLFISPPSDHQLPLIPLRERSVSRAYGKQTYLLADGVRLDGQQQSFPPNGSVLFLFYLSTLSAHRLSTVTPTEVFWMKGTSLQRTSPKGQSSAISCTPQKKNNHELLDVSGICTFLAFIFKFFRHFLLLPKIICYFGCINANVSNQLPW